MNKKGLIKDLKAILEPIIGYYSKIGSFGNHDSCHGANISWLELYCRSAYGVISYTKASGDNQYLDSFIKTLLHVVKDKRYASFHDYDQKAVEFVPVATLLFLFRDVTWDLFTKDQRESVEEYLLNINKVVLCNNNWILFRILVCAILQELTNKDYSIFINNDWQTIDGYYQGDGWYRDGKEGPKDYYNAFGFHFYSLLYYYLFKDNIRRDIIKERATLFAKQFILFYDNEGRSIPFGRSLIYRYAPLSFWSMMLVNGLLSKEEELRAVMIIEKNYVWWQKQSIYDQEGFQNLGYTYPNEYMLEAYNSSGSVYWSLKFFLVLLADDYSFIWNSIENEHNLRDGLYCLANNDIIVQKTGNSNIAFVNAYHGAGQAQDFAKYMHFAYNSATGFNISKSENNFAQLSDDSSLIFKINGKKHVRTDNLLYSCQNNKTQVYFWSIDDLIDIVTTVILLKDYYVRIHVIRSKKSCECYETGFPIGCSENIKKLTDDTMAFVSNNTSSSFICSIKGQGCPAVITNEEYSNLYYKDTIMPSVRYVINKGTSVLVDLTGYSSSDMSSKQIIEDVQEFVRIAGDTAIINTKETISIPLYITKQVSRQFLSIKMKKQCIKAIGNVKQIIKRFIKR